MDRNFSLKTAAKAHSGWTSDEEGLKQGGQPGLVYCSKTDNLLVDNNGVKAQMMTLNVARVPRSLIVKADLSLKNTGDLVFEDFEIHGGSTIQVNTTNVQFKHGA